MRRETTTSRVAMRPTSSRPMALLIGSLYGMGAGMTLALLLLSGLLPASWTADFAAMPLAFQAALTTTGALLGALITVIRKEM